MGIVQVEENVTILVVDDEWSGREVLKSLLGEQGYKVVAAASGPETLAKTSEFVPDLILLDVMMPGMDGFEVCQRLRYDPMLAEVPIIMVTALDDRQSRVRGLESGANDFISKPFDRIELLARVGTIIELNLKRKKALAALRDSMSETERLMLNILPASIAHRLKDNPGTIADKFDEVTILFADIVGFTAFAANMLPTVLVRLLNTIFSVFDHLTEKHGLEKIKTTGDRYMVAGGLPEPKDDHVEAIAELALDMQNEIARFNSNSKMMKDGELSIRIGINTGPVVAGVIGVKKFTYDLWGDTVNVASRMEEHGRAGYIQVTEVTYEHLKDKYTFRKRGKIRVKNRGRIMSYFLTGRKPQTWT